MPSRRRYVLGGVLLAALALAAVLLARVIGTVFFAVTVAYLLSPLRRELTGRGLSPWAASLVSTLGAFVATLVLTSPLVVVILLRLDAILALIDAVPPQITADLFGFAYTITVEEAQDVVLSQLRSFATGFLRAAPVLLIKLTLFGFVLFSLLLHEGSVRRGILAVIPPTYREVAKALDGRIHDTLFAIYVLQLATAVGTFLIALPLFMLLGYQFFITLATVSAILQFVPIVGPSLLLAAIAGFELVVGRPLQAALVFLVGGFFVAWLPDVLIRPRLASETTNLSGGLYFIGFVGGLLSLGPVGVIAGPLVIAVVAELMNLVSIEFNDVPIDEELLDDSE